MQSFLRTDWIYTILIVTKANPRYLESTLLQETIPCFVDVWEAKLDPKNTQ